MLAIYMVEGVACHINTPTRTISHFVSNLDGALSLLHKQRACCSKKSADEIYGWIAAERSQCPNTAGETNEPSGRGNQLAT